MRSTVAAALLVLAGCSSDAPSAVTTTSIASDVSTTSAAVSTTGSSTTAAPTSTAVAVSTSPPTAPATTNTESTGSIAPSTSAAPDVVTPQGFDRVAAKATAADGTVCELCLWLADDGDKRARGLMQVTDLGGPDGMLFRYPAPTTAAFWMKNTVMPLSIAFFDASGAYLDSFDMEPCTADPCDTYPTPNDFVHAVEVPQGGLEALAMTPGSTLVVSDLPCADG